MATCTLYTLSPAMAVWMFVHISLATRLSLDSNVVHTYTHTYIYRVHFTSFNATCSDDVHFVSEVSVILHICSYPVFVCMLTKACHITYLLLSGLGMSSTCSFLLCLSVFDDSLASYHHSESLYFSGMVVVVVSTPSRA